MTPSRRNLLIVVLVFWLLVAWLIASIRWEFDLWWNTARIFVPGALLLVLLLSIERPQAEPDVVILRTDMFGTVDDIKQGSYFMFPGLFTVVARMPNYPWKIEYDVARIDTQTAKLLRIENARVRCHYKIGDYIKCGRRVLSMAERIKLMGENDKLKPTDTGLWKKVLDGTISSLLDDKLRENVWQWAELVNKQTTLAATPPFADPQIKVENDPYALSLNRQNLAAQLMASMKEGADGWGLEVTRIVIETVDVSDDLIAKRTRNEQKELEEAQHQGLLDAIALRARGIAEADVRARTVKRILEALVEQEKLPKLSEETLVAIVRAALYTDGEMIWKGVLEKSVPGTPGTRGTPPGTAKTA